MKEDLEIPESDVEEVKKEEEPESKNKEQPGPKKETVEETPKKVEVAPISYLPAMNEQVKEKIVATKLIKSKADEILGMEPQQSFVSNSFCDVNVGKHRIL